MRHRSLDGMTLRYQFASGQPLRHMSGSSCSLACATLSCAHMKGRRQMQAQHRDAELAGNTTADVSSAAGALPQGHQQGSATKVGSAPSVSSAAQSCRARQRRAAPPAGSAGRATAAAGLQQPRSALRAISASLMSMNRGWLSDVVSFSFLQAAQTFMQVSTISSFKTGQSQPAHACETTCNSSTNRWDSTQRVETHTSGLAIHPGQAVLVEIALVLQLQGAEQRVVVRVEAPVAQVDAADEGQHAARPPRVLQGGSCR